MDNRLLIYVLGGYGAVLIVGFIFAVVQRPNDASSIVFGMTALSALVIPQLLSLKVAVETKQVVVEAKAVAIDAKQAVKDNAKRMAEQVNEVKTDLASVSEENSKKLDGLVQTTDTIHQITNSHNDKLEARIQEMHTHIISLEKALSAKG